MDGSVVDQCGPTTGSFNFSTDAASIGAGTIGTFTTNVPGALAGVNTITIPAGVTPPGSYFITYTVGATFVAPCTGGETATITLNVDGNPPNPVVMDATICDTDAYTLAPTGDATATMSFSPGAMYNYSVTADNSSNGGATPATGSFGIGGDVTFASLTNTTAAPVTVTIDVELVNECGTSGSETVTVTINPTPDALATDTNDDFCSGGTTAIEVTNPDGVGGTYDYTANYGAVTGGNAPQTGQAFGSSIAETLVNLTNADIVVTYTITPIGPATTNCADAAEVIMETVTVHPQPVGVDDTKAAVCSNEAFNFDPQDDVDNGNGVASTFAWTATYGALTGGATNGTGNIAETLVNNTAATINAVYTVTPTSVADNCVGATFEITVPVDPEPNIDNTSPAAVCSDVAIGLTYSVEAGSVAATTYNVNSITPAGALTAAAGNAAAANGVMANHNAADEFTNTTAGPLNVTYNVTPITAAGCLGQPENIVVTINPEPVMSNSVADQCSDVASGITMAVDGGSVAAAGFNVTAVVDTDLTGTATVGNGLAAGALATDAFNNVTDGDLDVEYTVVPVSADGCEGDAVTITFTVHPEPLGFNDTEDGICSGDATNYNLQTDNVDQIADGGNAVPSTFSWTAVYGAVTGGAGNPGPVTTTTIAETLTNPTNDVINVVYTVTPTSTADNCVGTDFTVTIPVFPAPNAMVAPATETVCSDVASDADVTTTVTDELLDIAVAATGGLDVTGATMGIQSMPLNIADAFTNTTGAQQTVTYTMTRFIDIDGSNTNNAGDCVGTDITFTLSVDPEPELMAVASQTICSATSPVVNLEETTGIGDAGTAASIAVTYPAGITGGSLNGTVIDGIAAANDFAAETLTNTTNEDITVTYTVTPFLDNNPDNGALDAAECEGDPIMIEVIVEPVPNGTAAPAALTVCSGDDFTGDVTLTTVTIPSEGSTDVEFVVVAVTPDAGITQGTPIAVNDVLAVTGTTNVTLGETLTNTTTTVQMITYTLEARLNGTTGPACIGNQFNVVVSVEPDPDVVFAGTEAVTVGATDAEHICADATTGASTSGVTVTTGVTPSAGTVDFEVTAVTANTNVTAASTLSVGDIIAGNGPSAVGSPTLMDPTMFGTVDYEFTAFIDSNNNDMFDTDECQGTTPNNVAFVIEPTPVVVAVEDGTSTPVMQPIHTCVSDVNTDNPDVDFDLESSAVPSANSFVRFELTDITITDNNAGNTTSVTATTGTQFDGAAGAANAAVSFMDDIMVTNPGSVTQVITIVYEFTPSVLSTAGPGTTVSCTGTPITVEVNVNPGPAAAISPDGSTTLCEMGTLVLQGIAVPGAGATAPFTHAWTLNPATTDTGAGTLDDATAASPTFTGTMAGSVTVQYIATSSEGCESAPVTLVLTVEDTPALQTISSDEDLTQCTAAPASWNIDIDASELGVTYELFLDGVSTAMTAAGTGAAMDDAFTVTATGSYTVVATQGNCSAEPTNALELMSITSPSVFDVTGGDATVDCDNTINSWYR